MGKMQREKGKRGEREAAALLSRLTGREVTRRVRQHDGDSDILGLDPWCVEVKLQKRLALDDWWAQALYQEIADGWPMLMWRGHGCRQWWVRSRLGDVMQAMGFTVPEARTIDMKVEDWVEVVGLAARK